MARIHRRVTGGEAVVAELHRGAEVVGYFSAIRFRRCFPRELRRRRYDAKVMGARAAAEVAVPAAGRGSP